MRLPFLSRLAPANNTASRATDKAGAHQSAQPSPYPEPFANGIKSARNRQATNSAGAHSHNPQATDAATSIDTGERNYHAAQNTTPLSAPEHAHHATATAEQPEHHAEPPIPRATPTPEHNPHTREFKAAHYHPFANPAVSGHISSAHLGDRLNDRLSERLTARFGALGHSDAATNINTDLARALPTLRARARSASQNSPILGRYLALLDTYVVGPEGAPLAIHHADEALAAQIATAWQRWAATNDARGGSITDIARLAIRSMAIDGEALIHYRAQPSNRNNDNNGDNHSDNPGDTLALELIDSAQLAMDNDPATRTILGVAHDKAGRITAYHLNTPHAPTDTARIAAENILHLFRADRPGQVRGAPWVANVLNAVYMLDEYQEEALIAARIGAQTQGFFKAASGDTEAFGNTPLTMDSAPGTWQTLPAGWDIAKFHAAYPNAGFSAFIATLHRQIAQGLGVSYARLSGDMAGYTKTVLAAALASDTDTFRAHQAFLAAHFYAPIFQRWLAFEIAAARLPDTARTARASVAPITIP